MTALSEDLIAAIDARVAWSREQLTAIGTVASITGYNDAQVTFDGSALSVPVKMSGEAITIPGDRVGMLKLGRWWTIVATYNRRWQSQAGFSTAQASGTTASATFVDVPTPTDVVLSKRWDATLLYLQIQAGSWTSAIPCNAAWGVRLTPADSSIGVTTVEITNTPYFAGAERTSITGWTYLSAMPATDYTCRVQWRRSSGTGTVTIDNLELISLTVMEVSP